MWTRRRARDHHDVAARPRAHRRAARASSSIHAPNACVRQTRSISAGSVSATVWPRDAMPALFTRMSTAPKSASTPRDHRLARGAVVDRRRVRDRAPAERLDLGDGLGRGVVVLAVVDRDVGAVGGEAERDRLADPAAAAGHQRDPPGQLADAALLLTSRRSYSSVNTGGRFSANACIASVEVAGEARQHLRAVLEVDAGLQAADLELAPHDLLGHAHAERAVADDELGGLERRRRRPAPSATTRVTSPMRSASAASMRRPVSSSSNARDAPTSRGSIHDTPMSQPDRPTRTNATLKRAVGGRDAHVAREREREPATRRRAVDRGDDRLRHRAHLRHEARDHLLHGHARPAPGRARAADGGDAPSVRSSPAQNPRPGAGEHDHPARAVVGELVERVVQPARRARSSSR